MDLNEMKKKRKNQKSTNNWIDFVYIYWNQTKWRKTLDSFEDHKFFQF